MRRERPHALRQRIAPLLVAVALGGLSTAASADWMRDYDRGLRALEQGDYRQAEQHFRAAIREKDAPAARQRFQGSRFEPYLPQHYAAMAAWQRGDCDAALDYWNHAALGAAIADIRDPQPASDRKRGMDECRKTRLAAEPAAPAPDTAAAPSAITTPPGGTPPAGPAVGVAATDGASRPPDAAAAPAAKPPVAAQTVASKPADTAPRPASNRGPAPTALVSAVEHYIAGRYGELEQANPDAATDLAARAHLLLLRAAARFAQAELGGGADAFEPVRADIRAARQAHASLTPDPALFPPRFRALWQQTR